MTDTAAAVDAATLRRNRDTVLRFSEAWVRGDVDGLLALMSDEPVYKGSTGPGPGTFFQGREAVREAFSRMVTAPPPGTEPPPVTPPTMYLFEDRALVYWHLSLRKADGGTSEVDGVDVLTFTADGRIAVKDAYRKAFP